MIKSEKGNKVVKPRGELSEAAARPRRAKVRKKHETRHVQSLPPLLSEIFH